MPTVLMLCYYFPPLAGGGVQRSAKFAKYLPQSGWAPLVISVEPNRRNTIEQGLDPNSLSDCGDPLEVRRCQSFELSGLYWLLSEFKLRRVLLALEKFLPLLEVNYKIGWYGSALAASRRELESRDIDLIYSTSTPYSSHLVAHSLKSEFGLPWVADFRDPWTQIATYRPTTPVHKKIDLWIEHKILSEADALAPSGETNS